MEHPGRRLVAGARPAGAEEGLARGDDLGLHEEIAERRMQGVGGGRRQHHLGVARQFELAERTRVDGRVLREVGD